MQRSDPTPTKAFKLPSLRGTASRQHALAVIEQGIAGGTNFLTMVVVGRLCGAEELGLFALGFTIGLLLISAQEALITIPLTIYLPRLNPDRLRDARGSTMLSGLILASVSGVCILAAAGVFYLFGVSSEIVLLAFALAPAVVGMLLRELARRMSFAELHVGSALRIGISVLVVLSAAIAWFVSTESLSSATAMLSIAIANLVAASGWFFANRRKADFNRSELVATTKRHWKMGRLLLASHIVSAGSNLSLPWIVAGLLGTGATGIFAACESIIRLSNPVISGITSVLTPRAAKAYAEGGTRRLRRVLAITVAMIGLFMLGFCLVIGVAGDRLLQLFYDSQYSGYGAVLLALALAKAAQSLSIPAGRGLLVYERVGAVLIIDVISCVVSISLTLLLVAQWGIIGAAIASLMSGLTVLVLESVLYWRFSQSADRHSMPPLGFGDDSASGAALGEG